MQTKQRHNAKEALHVCIANPPEAAIRQEFVAALHSRIVVHWQGSDGDLDRCQVLITGRPSAMFLARHPEITHIIIPFAGIPEETRQILMKYPQISVHNIHHNDAATAELAVTLMLAAAKFLIPFDQRLRENDWSPRYSPSPALLLSNKSALILGYGAIGRRVAKFCLALEMDVHATRLSIPSRVTESNGVVVHPSRDMVGLLQQADVLIITLPLTSATAGLITERELARLPQQCILVNVGRGSIVDQQALYQALLSGKIAAAGLDVWWQYPETIDARTNTPPSDYPFHQLQNVVFSPHRAGATRESDTLRYAELAKILNSLVQNGTMPNQVVLQRGY